jgi:hypothetical protein
MSTSDQKPEKQSPQQIQKKRLKLEILLQKNIKLHGRIKRRKIRGSENKES